MADIIDILFATRRCKDIILSAHKLKSPLRSLIIDYLPIECCLRRVVSSRSNNAQGYESKQEIMGFDAIEANEATKKKMSQVMRLILGLAGGDTWAKSNQTTIARNIGDFLKCFQNLQYLKLTWKNHWMPKDLIRPLEMMMSKISFPVLVSTQLNHMEIKQRRIIPFILRHASTLKYLELENTSCCSKSSHDTGTKTFLTAIKNRMKNLEKFHFLAKGDEEIYETGSWYLILEDDKRPIKVAELIEHYVLRKCHWPMVDAGAGLGWQPRFTRTHQEFINMSQRERNEYFEYGWNIALIMVFDLDAVAVTVSDTDSGLDSDVGSPSEVASEDEIAE